MLPDLLRQFLAAQPFIPFTLHLADGHHLEIQAPGNAQWLEDGVLAIVIPVKPFAGSLNSTDFAHYIDPRAITRIVTTAIPAALLPPEPEPLPPAKGKVLFICTHNSARSQMAEALLRHFAGDRFAAASAGLQPGTVHPLAVQVMQEIGLDITQARTKTIFDLYKAGHLFPVIISVCDDSKEKCPVFPGVRSTLHWSIPDPALCAAPAVMLQRFRAARETLAERVQDWSRQALKGE